MPKNKQGAQPIDNKELARLLNLVAAVGLEPLEGIENMQLTHYTKFLKRTNRSIGTSGVRGVYTASRKVSTEVEFSSLGLGRRSVSIVLAGFVTRLATVYGEHDDRALRFGGRFGQGFDRWPASGGQFPCLDCRELSSP